MAQIGTPLELYNHPANKFVAAFIGSPSMNFFSVGVASVEGGAATVALPGDRTARVGVSAKPGATDGPVELGVRPEHLALVDTHDPSAALTGTIGIVERLGNVTLLYVDTPAGQLIVEASGSLVVKGGDVVGLRLNEQHARLFGADGAKI